MKNVMIPRKSDRPSCHTEIICTVGPACRTPKKLAALIEAGMNTARLHCSYASHAVHVENLKRLRQAAKHTGKKVDVLLDLSGSKVRMNDFAGKSVVLRKGTKFTLTSREIIGNQHRVSINIPELLTVIKVGDVILLADGALKLEAISVNKREVCCNVLVGGRIKSGQAVHVPGKAAPVKVPTAKDRDDVQFGIEQGVDWIAQSFATTAREINDLRKFIHRCDADIPIIVKIERTEALDRVRELIQAADAVMVARGDLGLTTPIEEMAFIQKKIIRHCNAACKPVITATEMLFSMMKEPRPTRAEATDVANAILDGSDALMLSGETSMGKYPAEATRTLVRIALAAERHLGMSSRAAA